MSTTITISNVQLTLDQLVAVVRQLEPDARAKIAQALLADEMDERFAHLIKRLANKALIKDIIDEEINAEVRAIRQQSQ